MATSTSTATNRQEVNQFDREIRARTALKASVDSSGHLHPIPSTAVDSDSGSALSSGTVTPALPEDAPPSLHSIKHARKERRRLFPTVTYETRVSHFDPQSSHHDFRGFFALFWIGLSIMVLTAILRNIKDTGTILRTSIFSLFGEGPVELGIADLVMALTTYLFVPLQQRFAGPDWNWSGLGWVWSGAIQGVWLAFWVYLPFLREWQWTAQVFFTLHALVLLMKIHSYTFYCGHLSDCLKRLNKLDRNNIDSESTADSELRETLAFELTSPSGKVTYPTNLTYSNFTDYMLCPTLCYELSYPRIEPQKINWAALAEKASAVFGCVFLLTVTSEEFILPVMRDAAFRLETASTPFEILLILLENISLLLFPFTITFLLVFLVIFEYLLGSFAELTCFSDRLFYHDWWNSTDWLEFSREWNIPVHRFLQRHVYGASRPHMSRPVATGVTFLISALAHELVLFCITKKVRGYGFVCQMLQLPIIMVQRLPWMRRRKVLNNVLFWCSMIYGLAMISSLYVLV